jgi:hypothetical protein
MKTLTERQVEFLVKFASLILFAETRNIPFIITAYYRTPDEQNALFRRGLSRCDGYIKRSKHQERLAFDIVILDAEWKPINNYGDAPEYHALGAEWERLGGKWGGGPGFIAAGLNDIFHFQAGPDD